MSVYQKVVHFIKYHNAFTIIFVICFFGFGIGFAAIPEMRDSVYSSEETVVSIDNGLIISADLDSFAFNLRINSVTEDEKNYYAAYSYQTLVVEDGFWQSKEIEKTLTVGKEALGGKDLGLYVAEELGENIGSELSYLKRVQKLEKEKGESQKVVAVEYSGLIGKLLNPKEKVIEGYSPVIAEVVPESSPAAEPNLAAVIDSALNSQPLPEAPASAEATAGESVSEAELIIFTPEVTEPATSTPEATPEPVIEVTSTPEVTESATSTPEVTPEPEPEPATSTPEIIPEPEPEPATSTPEAVSEPAQ